VHQVQKKKKKKENRHQKKKKSIFWCPFPFDVGNDSRANPFEERGNDENQYASLNDSLLAN
jgi:hypothetical protein